MRPDPMPDAQETAWDAALRAHETTLVRGQRVRVMPGEGCHSHGEQEAGLTGVIIDTKHPTIPGVPLSAHRYLVLFDRPLWITRSSISTWFYAAGELTPIPWRTPEEVVVGICGAEHQQCVGDGER